MITAMVLISSCSVVLPARAAIASVSLAVGEQTTYALRSDGTVWAWGDNQFDQLGDGTTMVMKRVPLNFEGMSDVYTYTMGAYSNSEVPVQVYGLTGVTAIASGECSGYALKSDGTGGITSLGNWGTALTLRAMSRFRY
jgi:alpha-tubulin suppressor-like RCC1 family protein